MDSLTTGLNGLEIDREQAGMSTNGNQIPSSNGDLLPKTKDVFQLKQELEDLTEELSVLQSSLFEIEEARHSSTPPPPATTNNLLSPDPPSSSTFNSTISQASAPSSSSNGSSRVDLLLQAFTTHLEAFSGKIDAASIAVAGMGVASENTAVNGNGAGDLNGSTSGSTTPTPTPSRRRPPRQSMLQSSSTTTSTSSTTSNPSSAAAIHRITLQTHSLLSSLQQSWANLVDKEENLREELAEDRLVGVFRKTAGEAEGQMGSLERGERVLREAAEMLNGMTTAEGREADLDKALAAVGAYDAKKRFYVTGLTKSFDILDKKLNSRTTTNGEVLRRHHELSARWKALRLSLHEADTMVPRMKRQINALQSGGGGEMEEGDEGEGAEMLMDERIGLSGSGESDQREMSDMGIGAGLDERSLKGFHPHQAETNGKFGNRSRASTQGSDTPGRLSYESSATGRPSYGSSTGSPRKRTVSGTDTHASIGKGKGSFMNKLRQISLGTPKSTMTIKSPKMDHGGTPSLVGSMYSGSGSTSRSPQAGSSETSSNYFETEKRGKSPGPLSAPTFSQPKPRWNAFQKVETPKAEYDPSFYVDPTESPSANKGRKSISRQRSGLSDVGGGQASPDKSVNGSPGKGSTTSGGGGGGTSVVNRRRSFLPLPTHSTPNRPVSPAFSATSTTPSLQPRSSSYSRPSLPATSPGPGRQRAPSTSDVFRTPPPPVPAMPNSSQLQEKEAKAAAMRLTMQTPEPMLRANASKLPFYAGRQPSGYFGSPSRIPSGVDGMPTTPGRMRTPSRQGGPPSAFRGIDRPGSAASAAGGGGRAGASTPLPGMRGGLAFVPNKLDDLDMALAKLLDELPNDLLVERLDPPLRRGHLHDGDWAARYAITTSRYGRKEYQLRLLVLNKPGTGPGGKTQKVMIRDGAVSKDLRLFVLDMA